MSLCESINLSTKPYFVGQKAFSIAPNDRNKKKKTTKNPPKQRLHISPTTERKRPEWEWKEKIVTITLEKAEKVKNKKKKKKPPREGIIKTAVLPALLPGIIKIDCVDNFTGEIVNITEKAAVIVRKDGLKRADIVVDKWNFFFPMHSDAIRCFHMTTDCAVTYSLSVVLHLTPDDLPVISIFYNVYLNRTQKALQIIWRLEQKAAKAQVFTAGMSWCFFLFFFSI